MNDQMTIDNARYLVGHDMTIDHARYFVEHHMTNQFVKDARKVHGDRYDYSETWLRCTDETLNHFIATYDIQIVEEEYDNVHVLPKGTYYIGDPCYVLDDWSNFWHHNTKYGGGDFIIEDDEEDLIFFVESGTLSIVPIESIEDPDNALDAGEIVTFKRPFIVSHDEGIFEFGFLIIDTDIV